MEIAFEKLEYKHRKRIIAIYNHYIETSTSAFSTAEYNDDDFERFMQNAQNFPTYAVVNAQNGEIIGFCKLGLLWTQDSFSSTAKLTYFLDPESTGKGIGGVCLERLEQDAIQMGFQNLVAEISSENLISINFHMKHGFTKAGELVDIGRKFGRTFGVVMMQKRIGL